jgi:hypothetical protein
MAAHLEAADQALRAEHQAQPALSRMRTTIVILLADSANACWGHVGDSRLYHFRAGRLLSQTRDHSLPQTLADAGEISHAEIRHHEDRSRLLRVVGEEGASQPAIVKEAVPLCRSDAFLLCTDGFWENVYELEMELDFAKSGQPADWLALMETRLQERVDGSHDNYSAIAVFGDRLPLPPPPVPPVLAEVAPQPVPPKPSSWADSLIKAAALLLVPVLFVLALLVFVPDRASEGVTKFRNLLRKKETRKSTAAPVVAPGVAVPQLAPAPPENQDSEEPDAGQGTDSDTVAPPALETKTTVPKHQKKKPTIHTRHIDVVRQ